MPLPLEGPRPLSPLEREAVDLVFEDSIDPCDVYLTVLPVIEHAVGSTAASYAEGQIKINRSKFLHTDALNIKSRRAKTDIFKLANMSYLSRVIHECTHHWQSVHNKYTNRGPYENAPHKFSWEELQTLRFMKAQHKLGPLNPGSEHPPEPHELLNEQHASAAQVYFVIAWQLEHSSDHLVNLTFRSTEEDRVGPVERYYRIHAIPHAKTFKPDVPFDLCDPVPPGRRVSRECAMDIANDFNVFLKDLRRWGG